jgi:outer membrane protein assembly factor BamB
VRRPAIAVALLALAACGGGHGSQGAPAAQTPSATTAAGGEASASTGRAAWTTYGGSPSRAGVTPGSPSAPKLRRLFARAVDGQVYAQPLIARGRIYVATENNTVYAFTNDGALAWRRHLGAPVPGGDLPCGNIDPSGITGTPAIAHDRLFAVAFLASGHRHELFGLSLDNGKVAVRARVDPPNPLVEQQRGALLVAHGRVYVPYGGLFGDCGPFRGFVVSTTERGGVAITYRNPATEAGIWAPAGISAQAATLLVGTGNGGQGAFGFQNSVIRLSPGLRRLDYWAPTDWASLSSGDVDEGSLAPLPVTGGRVLQTGKDGVANLLRPGLGGVGGEQFADRLCDGGAFGAAAFRAPLAIVPCGGSLHALRLAGDRFDVAWRSDSDAVVPIVVGNSVFGVTRDGTLDQLSLDDGHTIDSTQVGAGASSFPAPAAAGDTLAVPAGDKLVVFSI